MVSIILASHNGERFISEAIQSVLDQTYADWELIVVNDASTDATVEIINKFSDARIRILHNNNQLGLTKSLNRGLSTARGDFIARIDDDDVWIDREKLAHQVQFMINYPEISLCGTQAIIVNEADREKFRLAFAEHDVDIRQRLLRSNQFVHSSVLIRRTVLDVVGTYDERIRYAQDYELWLRIGQKYKLANLPDYAVHLRQHDRSVSAKKALAQCWSFVKIAYRYRRSYSHFYRNLPYYGQELLLNAFLNKTIRRNLSAA